MSSRCSKLVDTLFCIYHEVFPNKNNMAAESLNLKEAFQHGFSIFKSIDSDDGTGNSKQMQVSVLINKFHDIIMSSIIIKCIFCMFRVF